MTNMLDLIVIGAGMRGNCATTRAITAEVR